MALTLYWGSGSPFAWRVLLALEHKRLPYESQLLHFDKQEQKSPQMLKLNPRGRVPVLKDGDYVVFESVAVLYYLDVKYPQAPIFGATPEEAGVIMRVICEFMAYAEPSLLRITEAIFSDQVADHIDETQEALGRRMLLENPSTYLRFGESDIPETDFLAEVARRTGCGLLLDVNNVFVSATNHGFDPVAYLARFPWRHVGEIHLAGYAEGEDDAGRPLLIDAHDSPVRASVWALYREAIRRLGPAPTLVEWDNDVPAWPVLLAEARRAEAAMARAVETGALRHAV